jgi:hypothetical protein
VLRISNILCPIDFDRGSIRAVPLAAELALQNQAVLVLLHVIHIPMAVEPLLSVKAGAKLHHSPE